MQVQITVRICETCKKPLNFKPDGTQEGIYCCDQYFHEGECIDRSFDGGLESWEDHYKEDGDCYHTEWEPEYFKA